MQATEPRLTIPGAPQAVISGTITGKEPASRIASANEGPQYHPGRAVAAGEVIEAPAAEQGGDADKKAVLKVAYSTLKAEQATAAAAKLVDGLDDRLEKQFDYRDMYRDMVKLLAGDAAKAGLEAPDLDLNEQRRMLEDVVAGISAVRDTMGKYLAQKDAPPLSQTDKLALLEGANAIQVRLQAAATVPAVLPKAAKLLEFCRVTLEANLPKEGSTPTAEQLAAASQWVSVRAGETVSPEDIAQSLPKVYTGLRQMDAVGKALTAETPTIQAALASAAAAVAKMVSDVEGLAFA